MKMPRLTVITPVYNGKRFIESCLQSVVDQNCPDLEHLIVDGASTDGTLEIVQRFARRYPHIRLLSEKDNGQSSAMNKGVTLARGEIIGFLNADDYYEPGIVPRALKVFDGLARPAFVAANCRVYKDDGSVYYINRPCLDLTRILIGGPDNQFPHNPASYFYHKSLHETTGPYDEKDHYSMDLAFLLKAIPAASTEYVDEIWGNYRYFRGTKTVELIEKNELQGHKMRAMDACMKGLPWYQRRWIRINRGLPHLKPFLPRALAGLFLLLALAAFSPVLGAGFLDDWDDGQYIIQNPQVLSPVIDLSQIFHSTVNHMYIPLTTLSFALEHRFFGLKPFVLHLDNLLLHLLTGALLYAFGYRLGLTRPQAALAAGIFALHPMHVESVAWATERKDVLCAVFYMSALITYANYASRRDFKAYAISLGCGLLSILAKPMAVSLPLVLWLIDWKFRRPLNIKTILDKVPFALLIFPAAWQTYAFFSRVPHLSGPGAFLNSLWSAVFYVFKFFLPVGLSPAYQPPSNYAPALAGAAFIACALWLWRGKAWVLWAFLFYAGSSFFLWRSDGAFVGIVADHYMYLPSAGFCLLLGYYLGKAPAKPAVALGLTVLMAGLSVLTWRQCGIWRDSPALWNSVLAHDPQNPIAYRQLGIHYLLKGDYARSMAALDKWIALKPGSAEGYNTRGVARLKAGQKPAAAEDFRKALAIQPNFTMARLNLAAASH